MTTPIVRVTGLTKSFQKQKVVDDLSFEIHQGEVYGFLGPNGAGKSTTIRMLLGLVHPDAGDIELFGRSLLKHGPRVLNGVGALVEEADFYTYLTARKNLNLLANMERVDRRRVDEVLELVGLTEWAENRVKTYSHGMKQRLGVAQALLSSPKFLILDEPTTGLDPKGMKEIRELILSLRERGLTVFLSSHLLHEVEQICTSLAIIHRGKLISSGGIEDLAGDTNLFLTEIHAKPLSKAATILGDYDFIHDLWQEQEVLKVSVSPGQVPRVNEILVREGVEVSAIIPRTRLEDYFLQITDQREIQK